MHLSLNGRSHSSLREALPESVIYGKSAAMQAIRRNVEKLGATNIPVLIEGESGTGKESLGLAIHRHCGGQDQDFIKVVCPTVPDSLLEEKLLRLAGRATLFLDAVAELDATSQAKFLQLLKDGPLAWNENQAGEPWRVRLICATNRDLENEAEAGNFRRDLFDRVDAFRIYLPPLRQRAEDIPDLVTHLLKFHGSKKATECRPISDELIRLMQRYHWPGNIRELENLIRRYVILGSEQVIGSELLAKVPTEFNPEQLSGESVSLKKLSRQAAREVERRIILRALEVNGWNRKLAARSLNISYRALLYKIKQGGMPPKRSVSSRPPVPVSFED